MSYLYTKSIIILQCYNCSQCRIIFIRYIDAVATDALTGPLSSPQLSGTHSAPGGRGGGGRGGGGRGEGKRGTEVDGIIHVAETFTNVDAHTEEENVVWTARTQNVHAVIVA